MNQSTRGGVSNLGRADASREATEGQCWLDFNRGYDRMIENWFNYVQVFYIDLILITLYFRSRMDEVCVIAGVRGSAIWRDDTGSYPDRLIRWSWVPNFTEATGSGKTEVLEEIQRPLGVWCLVGNFEIIFRRLLPNKAITFGKGKEWEGNDCNNG